MVAYDCVLQESYQIIREIFFEVALLLPLRHISLVVAHVDRP